MPQYVSVNTIIQKKKLNMKQTIKIGFICTSKALGGLELSTYKFGVWMKQRGHEVHYIICENSPLAKYLTDNKIPFETIKKGPKYLDFKGAYQLSKKIKVSGFDQFIITLSADIDLCALTKTIFHSDFKFYYFQEMQLGVDKKNMFFNWKFSKMEKWLTPLNWLHQQVLERTNVKEDKIVDIPLSIEVSKFNQDISQKDARDQLGISSDDYIFGFIGRIDPGKNPLLIFKAFEQVASQMPNAKLLIMGEKTRFDKRNYASELDKAIEKSKFSNQVIRKGFTDQVHLAYKAIDTFIMATNYESIGLVTVEAMASNCLVIGANGGGTPELLNYGDAGLLFEVENQDDLATQMLKAFKLNTEQKKSITTKAFTRVNELYSSEITCDIFERLLS